MITTRKSSVKGGAVSGNLLGKRLPKPKSQFSPSSGSGATGSDNKKAKKSHGPTAKKAILQNDEPTEAELVNQQAEASSSGRTGSSEADAGTASQWDGLSVSMRTRFASFLGELKGIYPTDGSKKTAPQVERAFEAAKEWINQKTMEDALACLYTWDRSNPDLRGMMSAARDGDRVKLEAALEDHMGRSSLKLDKLSSAQRTEYGAYKLSEAYLGLVCEEMEDMEEVFAEASLGCEPVARFIREKIVWLTRGSCVLEANEAGRQADCTHPGSSASPLCGEGVPSWNLGQDGI